MEEDFLILAIEVLKSEPDPAAGAPQPTVALTGMGMILGRASSALGQVFIDAGGVLLLINHLISSPARSTALLAVLSIAKNPAMAVVGACLAHHVQTTDLPTLCEKYPPDQTHPATDMLRRNFETAFGRPPSWPARHV